MLDIFKKRKAVLWLKILESVCADFHSLLSCGICQWKCCCLLNLTFGILSLWNVMHWSHPSNVYSSRNFRKILSRQNKEGITRELKRAFFRIFIGLGEFSGSKKHEINKTSWEILSSSSFQNHKKGKARETQKEKNC